MTTQVRTGFAVKKTQGLEKGLRTGKGSSEGRFDQGGMIGLVIIHLFIKGSFFRFLTSGLRLLKIKCIVMVVS